MDAEVQHPDATPTADAHRLDERDQYALRRPTTLLDLTRADEHAWWSKAMTPIPTVAPENIFGIEPR